MIIFKKQQISNIVSLYKSGETQKTISNLYKCDRSVIKRVLLDSGTKLRNLSESKRKVSLNVGYFKKINAPEKAYWLGFLYADGAINENRVRICISKRDEELVHKFKQSLNSGHKIAETINRRNGNEYLQAEISVTSKPMVKDLMKHGCHPRKTFTCEFPTRINKKLMPHFVRGYFDGDGCITHKKHYGKKKVYFYPAISIAASKQFGNALVRYFKNELNVKVRIISDKSIYSLRASNLVAIEVMKHLYLDADLYLERKRNKALYWIDKYNER
tara:strand:- start:2035 stop:2853 length:819 start_codon:yes stop_codon:yes gene_type:complete